MGAFGMRS